MYYNEKIIDGILMFKTTPNGEWKEATGFEADAVNAIAKLKDEYRLRVMRFFCKGCGTTDLPCHCQNDN